MTGHTRGQQLAAIRFQRWPGTIQNRNAIMRRLEPIERAATRDGFALRLTVRPALAQQQPDSPIESEYCWPLQPSDNPRADQNDAMSKGQNEAFSRILIDKALEFSGWDLLDPKQVVFELHSGTGRADYLLKDKLARTLCVLEAKRENLDPYDAKEQARGYAENLNAPFVLLSNGREHWFWNFQRADQRDAYRIERLPSRDDLERVRLKNMQPPRPLGSEIITKEYLEKLRPGFLLHRYQIPAMDEIARQFDSQEMLEKGGSRDSTARPFRRGGQGADP
jgi:Type I restriction enzyme R protein N terminus (HSDR_N)